MAFNSTPRDINDQNINGLLSCCDEWVRVELSDIAKVINGFAFKSAKFNSSGEGHRLIRIRDVLKGDTKTYFAGDVPDGYWVFGKDIIIGMDGDFNIAWWDSEPALLNQRVCKIDQIKGSFDKRLLFRLLPGYLDAINANTSSTTVKHLSSKTLEGLLLPLPPLAEQKIIADKLDTLLAQVETTKARLERIPNILKSFRQSVLAAAVSGKLTEEWREFQKFATQKSTVGDFVSIDIGHAFKSKEFTDSGVKLLRGQNIEPGALKWDETKYFPSQKLGEHSNLFIRANDIILAMDRPIISTGLKLARAKEQDLPCVLVQRVARFTNFDGLHPDYLFLLLRDIAFSNYIQPNQTGSDIPHISGKQILAYGIQVPALSEQTEIVRRVEELFAFADTIEQKANAALDRVNNLTQSILAKAFRGELTADWRAANPDLISGENSAEALLEKIKAEREAMKKQPK